MILRLRFRLVCGLSYGSTPSKLPARLGRRPGKSGRTGRGRRRIGSGVSLILDAGAGSSAEATACPAPGRLPGPGPGGLPGGVPPTVQGEGSPAGKAKHPRDGRARHGSWERAARPRNPSARAAGPGATGSPGSISTSSEGPQIEQSASHDLPIAFRAFLAQRRVRKQSSHRAAFATASCGGRQARLHLREPLGRLLPDQGLVVVEQGIGQGLGGLGMASSSRTCPAPSPPCGGPSSERRSATS